MIQDPHKADANPTQPRDMSASRETSLDARRSAGSESTANHESELDLEWLARELSQVEPPTGLESRVLRTVQARQTAGREDANWNSPSGLARWFAYFGSPRSLATVALLIGAVLLTGVTLSTVDWHTQLFTRLPNPDQGDQIKPEPGRGRPAPSEDRTDPQPSELANSETQVAPEKNNQLAETNSSRWQAMHAADSPHADKLWSTSFAESRYAAYTAPLVKDWERRLQTGELSLDQINVAIDEAVSMHFVEAKSGYPEQTMRRRSVERVSEADWSGLSAAIVCISEQEFATNRESESTRTQLKFVVDNFRQTDWGSRAAALVNSNQ